MLKFIFGKKGIAKQETQRQAFERMVTDLNDAIAGLDEKPKLTMDLNTGGFALELPDRLPDEALALPAPDDASDAATSEADQKDAA